MKTIKNFLFTIAMMGIVLVVYINIDEISDSIKKFLVRLDKPVILEGNDYTRDYEYIQFTYDEDYEPMNSYDIRNIYFNILNNGWEKFSFYCRSEYENCINEVKDIANNKVLMSKINNYVHPYNSYKEINTKFSGNKITVSVTYKYDLDKQSKINAKVNSIIESLNISSLDTKGKIEAIHNYIINNTVYDNDYLEEKSDHDSTSAYGNLIEGFSVCSGYSDAMAIFLDKFDIPNLKVSSDDHIWNLVYVNNEWLHLDLTWDDTENSKYDNNYFLITKKKLFTLDNKEHNFDSDFFLEAL